MKRQPIPALSLAALFSTILWTACTKSHSNTPGTSAQVTLITQTSWRYDTSGVDLNKDGIVDIGGDTLITTCEKDDIYTFKSDSTGAIDEGATKCHVSDPQTVPFKWSFTNNATILTATAPPLLTGNINILSLTSTKFVLYRDTTLSGISVRYLVSLKH
ncbi:MAG TPA: hypothetical protein VGM30_00745 [Puia sp.]|jgi:hypothetical protein